MNFRKVVSLCALSAAAPILAGVTGSNTTGLLEVDSTATNTIVSVPWLSIGSGSAINVADIVRTQDLTAGDMVLAADSSGKYQCWTLVDGAWTSATIANVDDLSDKDVKASAAAAISTLERGKGIWLIRQNPTDNSGEAIPFYLYGQYSSTAISTTIEAGTAKAPAYHLLGNPKSAAAALPISGLTPTVNDTVVVPNGNNNKIYKWSGTAFTRKYYSVESGKRVEHTENLPAIAPGTGFWYVSRGGSGTITW